MFTAEHFTGKRRNKTTEVGAATGTSDDNIRNNIIFFKSSFSLKTYYSLVEKYLIENASENIAVTFLA